MTSESLEQSPEGLPGLESRALVPSPPTRRRPRGESVSRPPVARMMRIHDLIQRGTHPNCTTLANELEVSDKTVMRDIEFMRDRLQLPIAYNALHRGFIYTGEVAHFPRITVTEGELVALLVAQKALEPYKGTDFEKPLRSALQKMSSGMHESGQFSIQDLQSAISFRPVGLALQELRTFDTLAQAVATTHVVEFDYFKLKGKKSERRRIEPYHLGCIDNQWYLIGHDLVRAQTRTFALTRLSNPKILKQFFRRPENFSIEGMMASSFSAFETPKPERVVIRLDPFAARLAAERTWHPSQRLKPAPGGGAVLTLEVGLAPDLENWILGWGSHAKVLEPAALCDRIASIARAMALQYSA